MMWSTSVARPGSSPLARGLPIRLHETGQPLRIIPARAGFTPSAARPRYPQQDHPRSRGVYWNKMMHVEHGEGSSPLARGLRSLRATIKLAKRIIPARAGFTPQPVCRPQPPRDHPRSRGVYDRTDGGDQPERGSSPLARGLHHVADGRGRVVGIIPARAGFTHPSELEAYAKAGSSPLARGLRGG